MAELEAAQATPKPAAAMVARGMGLYRHTTAVLAAFSLAAFAGHLWNIGWRGILEQLVGYWDAYVRPVTAWISHTLVSTPLSWAGLHVQVPVLLRDYLSVGFILALSFHRADFAASPSPKGKGRLRRVARNVAGRLRVPTNRSRGGRFSLAAWLLWPPLQILIWPVVSFVLVMLLLLPAVIYVTRYHKENPIGRQAFKVFLTSLAPLVYLGVLFAVNYLVLR